MHTKGSFKCSGNPSSRTEGKMSVECISVCYVGLMQMKEEAVELNLNLVEGRKLVFLHYNVGA